LEDVGDVDDFYSNILYFLSYEGIIDSEMIYGFCHYDKNPVTKKKHIDFYNRHNKTEQLYKVDGVTYTTNELMTEGLNCIGCKCHAGTNDIIVNADGEVFTCASDMMISPPVVNILTDPQYTLKLHVKSKFKTTCKYEHCTGDYYQKRQI